MGTVSWNSMPILFIPLAAFLLYNNYPPELSQRTIQEHKDKRLVVLIGASVGREWALPSLPQRIGDERYVFEFIAEYDFDKSAKLKEVLNRQKEKPDAIILKECATYFPGNMCAYQNLMKSWVQECQKAGIVPILSTVAPVTRIHPFKVFLIRLLKAKNPFRQRNPFSRSRIRSILKFNDWIRAYCRDNNLALLDLEATLRFSDKNRFLREDFAKRDGLHLNSKAYRALDRIIIPVLEKIDWQEVD